MIIYQVQIVLLQLSNGRGQHGWESQNSPGLLAAPNCSPRKEAMPCFLLACLIAMVIYLFVHPDTEFGPVLVSYWICCHIATQVIVLLICACYSSIT